MIVRALSLCLLLIYPFAIWQLLERGCVAGAAAVLAACALLAAVSKRSKGGYACAVAAAVLAVCATLLDWKNALKLYPVFVNATLLTVFALSLRSTPIVEKFARLRQKDLPRYAVAYCRGVTQAWCVFFVVNGLVALDSALFRSDAWWGLYNGAVSYVLVALMFAVELGVRRLVRHRHKNSGELT